MKMCYVKLLSHYESCISLGEFSQMTVLLSLLIVKSVWLFSTLTFTNRRNRERIFFK